MGYRWVRGFHFSFIRVVTFLPLSKCGALVENRAGYSVWGTGSALFYRGKGRVQVGDHLSSGNHNESTEPGPFNTLPREAAQTLSQSAS